MKPIRGPLETLDAALQDTWRDISRDMEARVSAALGGLTMDPRTASLLRQAGIYRICDQLVPRSREGDTSFLVVDPGATCGVAKVDREGKTIEVLRCRMERIETILDALWPVSEVVVERWFLYPNSPVNTFSDMPGPEAIGMVRSWAIRRGLEVHRVAARLRRPYLGEVADVVTNEHCRDAVAHAFYWLDRTSKEDARPWSSWSIRFHKTFSMKGPKQ